MSSSSASDSVHHRSSDSSRRPPARAAGAAEEENDADEEGDEGPADRANSSQTALSATSDKEHRRAVRHSSEALPVPAEPSSTDAAAAAGDVDQGGERSASFGDETEQLFV